MEGEKSTGKRFNFRYCQLQAQRFGHNTLFLPDGRTVRYTEVSCNEIPERWKEEQIVYQTDECLSFTVGLSKTIRTYSYS